MGAFKNRVVVAVDEWAVREGKGASDLEALAVAFPFRASIVDYTPSPAVAVALDDYLLYLEEVQDGFQRVR